MTKKAKRLNDCNPTALSLFSGAGGMDLGFKNAGINVVVANEFNQHASNTFKKNHPDVQMVEGDINDKFEEIVSASKGVEIVFGGPPCQCFSVAGKMDPDDERSKLVWDFLSVVGEVKPEVFVLENVKALGVFEKWKPIREKILKTAENMGYHCHYIVLNSAEFGVPQNRERVFFFGAKKDLETELQNFFHPLKKEPRKLREVFSELPLAGSKENPVTSKAKITLAKNPVMRKSHYSGMLFNGGGRPLNLDEYSYTLPASMGGNNTPIVDDFLIADDGAEDWVKNYHSEILSNGSHKKEVPKNLRRITTLEAAAIQGFPPDYSFSGPKSSIYTQIGNAVPVGLAEAVGIVAKKFLLC